MKKGKINGATEAKKKETDANLCGERAWIKCPSTPISVFQLSLGRVEKFSKNYVRNALKCAYFSKSSAQKPYIIMRLIVLKCA